MCRSPCPWTSSWHRSRHRFTCSSAGPQDQTSVFVALDAPACRADCAAYLAPVVADPSKLDSLIAVVLLDGWQFGSLDARRPQRGCWSQQARLLCGQIPRGSGNASAPRWLRFFAKAFVLGGFWVSLWGPFTAWWSMRSACGRPWARVQEVAFLGRTAPVSLRSMVSLARGMSCLRLLRFAYELSSSAERATRRAGSKRIAWLGCARGAACLLDCLTALVLLCRFGTAVLLPSSHVGCSSEQIRKGRKERPAGGPGVPDIKKS